MYVCMCVITVRHFMFADIPYIHHFYGYNSESSSDKSFKFGPAVRA
jgi:hypothetical protein